MDWPRHPAESLPLPAAPPSLGLCYALMAAAAPCTRSLCAFASHFDLKAARQTKIKMGEKTTKQASERRRRKIENTK